jgi:hypothetical protein
MKRTIGAILLAIALMILVRGTRTADAQPPSPPPAQPPTADPLPLPPLPGQPGLMVPIRIHPDATNPPAKTNEPAAPKAKEQKSDDLIPVHIEVAKETAEPPLAESTAVAPSSSNSLITGTMPVPAEMGPGREVGNPNGRQEPSVSIEWQGPTTVKVGQSADHALIVRNTCATAVQQVVVRVKLAGQASVLAAEPKARVEDNVLIWDLGTLLPKQDRALQMRILTPARGDIAAQAWVTFTGATAMRVRVREPKLMVKAAAPEKVMLGDVTTFSLTVANPGDGVAEQVKLHAELADGLEHPKGKKIDFDVGSLNPGESRTVQVVCLAKAGGEQVCQAVADADAGLKADARAAAVVMTPRLDVEAKGPKLRYLDRHATYTFKVTNSGDVNAANVTLTDLVPTGQKIQKVENGGRTDTANRLVSWFLGEIAPGQSREVSLEVVCSTTGEFAHKVSAQAARGLKGQGQVTTKVEGLSAIALELIDIEDPVEVNGETTYEIKVMNTGTKTETDVKIVCTIPADFEQFKSASGPTGYKVEGNEIVFEPLPKLAPRADAIYRISVKCTTAGIAHFKARMTSAILTEPVTKEEATRIYQD